MIIYADKWMDRWASIDCNGVMEYNVNGTIIKRYSVDNELLKTLINKYHLERIL